MLYNDPLELIGNTPLVKLNKLSCLHKCSFYVKLEKYNFSGSVKDRAALEMIENAEREQTLKPGMTLVESSSGNLGIAIAAISSIKGYKFICIIDPKTTLSKINTIKAYGGKVIMVDQKDDNGSYINMRIKKVKELLSKHKDYFNLDQYNNLSNTLSHYKSTGPEIFHDLEGQIDSLVGSVSTCGTMVGTAKFLKKKLPKLFVVGVEPEGSVIFGGKYKSYYQQGPGSSFIPGNFDNVFDQSIKVGDRSAFRIARDIAKKEGIFVGGSSGAAVWAAIRIAKLYPNLRNIVIICPDSGERYIDTIFSKEWLKDRNLI